MKSYGQMKIKWRYCVSSAIDKGYENTINAIKESELIEIGTDDGIYFISKHQDGTIVKVPFICELSEYHTYPIDVVVAICADKYTAFSRNYKDILTGKMFTYVKNMVNYFRNYLTSYNEDISLEEIRNYILKCYPRLNEFMNIKSYLLNERKIIDVFGQGYLSFYAMRQDIKLVDNIERNKTGNFDKKYNLK